MEAEKNRKIIAKFPTLLEAEAAAMSLEASGISALINNEFAASMMPHASSAFGGFHVSVEEENTEEALQILRGATQEGSIATVEPLSNSWKVHEYMKRATYGAAMGCIFLPLIANVFSLNLFRKAYQCDSKEFWKHNFLLFLGLLFNVFGILAVIFLGFHFLK